MTVKRKSAWLLIIATAVATCACAAIQPTGTGGPKAGPPYPVILTEQTQRREATVVALKRIAQTTGWADQPETHLQPVTAVIKNLPKTAGTPLLLPKVGVNAEMNEEETREALRRFINEWRVLIGANPAHLSLVDRIDQPDGIKIARYEQRPFRYPLRGGYGRLEIRFLSNRTLVDMISTCLPDSERLQSALAVIAPSVTVEDAMKYVRENGITYTDASGNQQSYHLSNANEVNATELVTYVAPSPGRADSLELHLAWEISITQAPIKTAYLDAVDGKIIPGSAMQ